MLICARALAVEKMRRKRVLHTDVEIRRPVKRVRTERARWPLCDPPNPFNPARLQWSDPTVIQSKWCALTSSLCCCCCCCCYSCCCGLLQIICQTTTDASLLTCWFFEIDLECWYVTRMLYSEYRAEGSKLILIPGRPPGKIMSDMCGWICELKILNELYLFHPNISNLFSISDQ